MLAHSSPHGTEGRMLFPCSKSSPFGTGLTVLVQTGRTCCRSSTTFLQECSANRSSLLSVSSGMLCKPLVLAKRFEQFFHIVGVLFLLGQDLLHRDAGGGIVIAKVANDLVIGLHRDPLSDKVLPNHVQKRFA